LKFKILIEENGFDEATVCEDGINIHSKVNNYHIMRATVGKVYLLLGRDVEG